MLSFHVKFVQTQRDGQMDNGKSIWPRSFAIGHKKAIKYFIDKHGHTSIFDP